MKKKPLRYEPRTGECLSYTAQRMIELARQTAGTVKAKFNNIELTATPDSNADDINRLYCEESERRSEAYRNSPEGKKAAREAEQRKKQMQRKHDALMRRLPKLNFADDVAVLDWLCELQEPSNCIGIVIQRDMILSTFAAHGYYPNVNCGKDYNRDDRDNVVRWLIEQALYSLQSKFGAISRNIQKFTDDFKKKFVAAT